MKTDRILAEVKEKLVGSGLSSEAFEQLLNASPEAVMRVVRAWPRRQQFTAAQVANLLKVDCRTKRIPPEPREDEIVLWYDGRWRLRSLDCESIDDFAQTIDPEPPGYYRVLLPVRKSNFLNRQEQRKLCIRYGHSWDIVPTIIAVTALRLLIKSGISCDGQYRTMHNLRVRKVGYAESNDYAIVTAKDGRISVRWDPNIHATTRQLRVGAAKHCS